MAPPKFAVESTKFPDSSDSEAEDAPPRTEPMRHNESIMTGGKMRTRTCFLPVEVSPKKGRREHSPAPDFLYPDVAPAPERFADNWDPQGDSVGENGFTFDDGHPVQKGPREARKSDRPLEDWSKYDLEAFADEILRVEGRGDYCSQCTCIVTTLSTLLSLWALGLRIQLGHKRGEPCPETVARTKEDWDHIHQIEQKGGTFCVVDDKVVHEVGLDFCTCGMAADRAVQLLRARLFPSTTTRPSSAATFRVLRRFHKLSFEAKCSAYEFYNALARETNNTGNFQPRNRYSEFLRMTREWRHVQEMKCFGRVHLILGLRNIPAGVCALLYPACPQPGKNLDADGEWKKVPPSKRFLYALFVAIDANFRMKRKQVSSEESDPDLNKGSAFFSEVHEYMAHVGAHREMEQEKSHCVSHDAVDQPNREARGTASSGIGTVDCARHNMKRPNGVGDLQKGERYINMDYMFWKSLEGYDDLVQLVVSYDIVCQWRINIWRRLAEYQPVLRRNARTGQRYYMWLIPKFHLPAHIEACNILYSFNLTPYVGQTDGEAPERGWANANPLAASTKEMGPGSRRDTLDDHFNDWNHQKIIALGTVMLERVQKAVGEMVDKQRELVEVEASLPTDLVALWRVSMELSFVGVLRRKSPGAVEGDRSGDVRGDLHAYEMLAMGMQLEQQQRELAADIVALKNHASDGQKTTVLERGNKLRRKIASWVKLQTDFQPDVKALRTADDDARAAAARMQPAVGIPVHALELWLPSKQARTPGASLKLTHARYEFDMREAQAHEALDEVRNLLLLRTHQYKLKDMGKESGVAGHTRQRTAIELLDERARRAADEYRAAYRALSSLAPKLQETKWYLVLKPLASEDVRGMPRALFSDPEKKKRGKRKRGAPELVAPPPKEMSWIWRTGVSSLAAAASTSEEAVIKATNESLRVEWAKTRARAARWTEEVDLLEEEMCRILVFLEWKATWWRSLKGRREDVVQDRELTDGFNAYAERQAVIQETMKGRFEDNWKDVARWIEFGRQGVLDNQAEMARASGEEEEEDESVGGPSGDEGDDAVPMAPRNAVALSASVVEASLLPTAHLFSVVLKSIIN
ncbi:hypothetical protein C8F04DRAFT_1187110 [Mycena alexandri]|uniref:CxC2-like cysteine cluster KDZ transposase-associated domain-containing protein n=1 Tax=Mycena alexandri TaxID=1745969 RepID=A0AAD6WZD4_9AGAR|nr:hypothetical protein C8F04DRAFT_1187110 [Mycena alexandri]